MTPTEVLLRSESHRMHAVCTECGAAWPGGWSDGRQHTIKTGHPVRATVTRTSLFTRTGEG